MPGTYADWGECLADVADVTGRPLAELRKMTPDQLLGLFFRARNEKGRLVLSPPPGGAGFVSRREWHRRYLWANGITDRRTADRLWAERQTREARGGKG